MIKEINTIKFTVQRRIVFGSAVILAAKLAAYFLTNSVGILTDALESIVNVTAGFISLYSISIALKPKDADHPFGHGKVEMLSASVEGFMIILAGIIIIYEAVKRLFIPSDIQQLDLGIIIVAVGGFINYLLGYYSIRVGRKHNSMALIAGGKHLHSDFYSTIGLVIGLILLFITKIAWLDSAIALIFGSIIIITGIKILKETTSNLMDETDFNLLENLTEILWENKSPNWIDIHNLKLLKYGDSQHIDCDLTLPWYINIKEAHKEGELIKEVIISKFTEIIDLNVHTDACTNDLCRLCLKSACKYRENEFVKEVKWDVKSITKNKEILGIE
jgi:cation diffusion facilitator family transporter